MKKYLPAAPFFALLFGTVAMALRLWFLSAGEDAAGLLPRNHPGQIGVYILSLLALAFFWLLSRQVENREPDGQSAPPSVIGAAGYLASGAGLMLSSLLSLLSGGDKWQLAADLLGSLSGLCFAWGGLLRLRGQQMPFVIHALPTLYFALRVFLMGKILGAEPEISRYILQFFASLALLPALYHLWGRDVALENERKIYFWSLLGGYFCLAAALGSGQILVYGPMAALLLTNLPQPQPQMEELSPEEYAEVLPEEGIEDLCEEATEENEG